MASMRRSLTTMVSMRSADDESYKDDQAGLLSPQDNNALSRMVNRTQEVDDKQWARLHTNSRHTEDAETKAAELDVGKGINIPKVPKGSSRTWFWRKGIPILNPYSKIYGWWCAYVLMMDATYTAFVVPIGVGFNTSSVQWDWVGIFDFIAGVTFFGELLLNWNVAFVATHNLRKRIVLKRRRIASFYVWHSTFLFDLISTMVFIVQMIGYGLGTAGSSSGTIIQVVQILRALRLLRLMKLLQQLFVMSLTAPQTNVPLINRAMPIWLSYLAQLMYIVGLFINILACLWVFVALREEVENTWINNYEYFVSAYAADPSSDTLTRAEAIAIPGPTIYLAAAYWSLTTVATIGFGDILPVTNAERAVMLFVQITGVLFFGILLGSITSLLQRASQEVKDAQMFREKMGSVQDWMSRVKLPRDLKQKIRGYYAEVWVRQHLVEHDLQLFKELPQHLRAQVAWRSNKPIFDKILTFQELSEETQYMIAARAKPVKIAPGHEICSQGDSADSVWLLHEGEVIATYHYHEAEVEKAPAIVGYTALLAAAEKQYNVRPCGYRALMPCMLWELTMQDLQPIVDWQEDVAAHLEKAARAHLANRQSLYPHLWGLDSKSQGTPQIDDASASDDEGIDSDNEQVKHYSTDDDVDLDTDRTGATLKPPNRHRKHLLVREVDSSEAAADKGSAQQSTQAGHLQHHSPDPEHVVLNMQYNNVAPDTNLSPEQASPQTAQHSLVEPSSHQPPPVLTDSLTTQRLHHRSQQPSTSAHVQQQQQQPAANGDQRVECMHDSAGSQGRAQGAAMQQSLRAVSLAHDSTSQRHQVPEAADSEADEGSEPHSRQLGLSRHQQHQHFQQQRLEQEQQEKLQEQQQQQQQQQQLSETDDQDASGTGKRRLMRFVSRGRQKLAGGSPKASAEPALAEANSSPELGQTPEVEPIQATVVEPNQAAGLRAVTGARPYQAPAPPVKGTAAPDTVNKDESPIGHQRGSQQTQLVQAQPDSRAGSSVMSELHIQQQLLGLTEAAEQIRVACLQLQRQLQQQQQQQH